MQFPEKPTCHEINTYAKEFSWREPDADRPFRRCSYCGGCHFEDLLKHLEAGARLESADWKYGWPHKFYIRGAEGQYLGKLYAEHFKDAGFDHETFEKVATAVYDRTGVAFFIDQSGRLAYKALRSAIPG